MNYGFCRSCGRQILWVRTLAGRAMPLDPDVIRFAPACGPETFVTPEGKVERGQRTRDGQIGYISHFATCPNADRHRKRGAK